MRWKPLALLGVVGCCLNVSEQTISRTLQAAPGSADYATLNPLWTQLCTGQEPRFAYEYTVTSTTVRAKPKAVYEVHARIERKDTKQRCEGDIEFCLGIWQGAWKLKEMAVKTVSTPGLPAPTVSSECASRQDAPDGAPEGHGAGRVPSEADVDRMLRDPKDLVAQEAWNTLCTGSYEPTLPLHIESFKMLRRSLGDADLHVKGKRTDTGAVCEGDLRLCFVDDKLSGALNNQVFAIQTPGVDPESHPPMSCTAPAGSKNKGMSPAFR